MQDQVIEMNVLRDGIFETLPVDDSGILRSKVFPGLWVDTIALLAGDLAKALTTLQSGLTTPEHQQFADRLAQARS